MRGFGFEGADSLWRSQCTVEGFSPAQGLWLVEGTSLETKF